MNTPQEIALNYLQTAKAKTTQKWYKTLILAVLAGAYIAFGAVTATAASATFTGSAAALVKGAVFPVGLILVVVCGAELFTGNCLLFAPLMNRKVSLAGVLKCLGIAYIGNFIGALLVAVLAVYSHVFNAQSAAACVAAAEAKCNLTFADGVLRGILCNVLVCLAVWAAMASKNIGGKILALYMPIFAFVVCGFEHCVANMYYLFAGLMASSEYPVAASGLNVGNALCFGLLAPTLGNIVGGFLIAAAYWGVYLGRGGKGDNA